MSQRDLFSVEEAQQPFAPALTREASTVSGQPLDSLTDAEVLGRILERNGGYAAALIILDEFGSVANAAAATEGDFVRRTGLPVALLQQLRLAREFSTRILRSEISYGNVLTSWEKLKEYLQLQLSHERTEQFRVLYLDRQNRLIADELMGRGSIAHAPVYPREVIRRALEHSSSALVFVHNHPSGDPSPSRGDIEMTQKLITAAAALDIKVHDHVIVAGDQLVSFRQKLLIN